MAPVGYGPPGFYGQYPTAAPAKPGEAPIYYPQFYLTPMPTHAPPPPPHNTSHDGETNGYPVPPHGHAHPHPQAAQFYPTFVAAPYAQPYPPPQYVMHPNPHPHPHPHPEMAMSITSGQHRYAPYPQMYVKPPSRGTANGPVASGTVNGAANGVDMMPVPLDSQGRGREGGAGRMDGMNGSHGKAA